MMRRVPLALLALALALAACGPSPTTTASSPKPVVKKASAGPSSGVGTGTGGGHVGGTLYAPRNTKAGSYALLLLSDLPVANAPISEVALTPGGAVTAKGATGSNGQYDLTDVPLDAVVHVRASIVTADGKPATLDTLGKCNQSLASDIDIASTMVALTLIAHARGGTLSFDPIAFTKAVNAVQSAFISTAAPDPTAPDALVAKTEDLAKTLDDLNAVVGGPLQGGATATPGGQATATPGTGATTPATSQPTPSATATGQATTAPTPSATTTAQATAGATPTATPVPAPTPGQPKTFGASLGAALEVPSSNATGTGQISCLLAADRSNMQLSGSVTGLSGTITEADLIKGPPGPGATVLHTISVAGSGLSMTWSTGDGVPLTVDGIAALEAGNLYVNILTAAHPKGEIIGQLK